MFVKKYVHVVMRESTYGTAIVVGVFSDKDKAIKAAKYDAEQHGWSHVGEDFYLGHAASMLYWNANGKSEYITYTITHELVE